MKRNWIFFIKYNTLVFCNKHHIQTFLKEPTSCLLCSMLVTVGYHCLPSILISLKNTKKKKKNWCCLMLETKNPFFKMPICLLFFKRNHLFWNQSHQIMFAMQIAEGGWVVQLFRSLLSLLVFSIFRCRKTSAKGLHHLLDGLYFCIAVNCNRAMSTLTKISHRKKVGFSL